jgi:hypothetical protein
MNYKEMLSITEQLENMGFFYDTGKRRNGKVIFRFQVPSLEKMEELYLAAARAIPSKAIRDAVGLWMLKRCRTADCGLAPRVDELLSGKHQTSGALARIRVEFMHSRRVSSPWAFWQGVFAIGPSSGAQGEPATSWPSPELHRH